MIISTNLMVDRILIWGWKMIFLSKNFFSYALVVNKRGECLSFSGFFMHLFSCFFSRFFVKWWGASLSFPTFLVMCCYFRLPACQKRNKCSISSFSSGIAKSENLKLAEPKGFHFQNFDETNLASSFGRIWVWMKIFAIFGLFSICSFVSI